MLAYNRNRLNMTRETSEPDGLTNVRQIRHAVIGQCPFVILVPSHYRDDETCKCDDASEREMMIREWGYSPEDFKGIPLRKE